MGHVEGRGTARRRKTGIRRWETTGDNKRLQPAAFYRRLRGAYRNEQIGIFDGHRG